MTWLSAEFFVLLINGCHLADDLSEPAVMEACGDETLSSSVPLATEVAAAITSMQGMSG